MTTVNTEDQRLLDFDTYEEYLDSFVTREDLCYLRSLAQSRIIAELGYRSTGETLSKDQFENRRNAIREVLFPSRKPHILASQGAKLWDPFLSELALRERSNRVGLLSTIIFLRHYTKSGFEISGYIDFEQSLRKSRSREEDSLDWDEIFSEKKRLWPQPTDLGYYHWKSGYSVCNNTDNYKVITNPKKGLIFLCRHDRKTICADPLLASPGSNTTRTIIFSEKYDHVILFDHVIRRKL